MARSNAASRDSERGATTLSSIDALIGAFASSATAGPHHAPTRISAPANAASLFIDDQCVERRLFQLVPTVEKRELDHECHPDDLPAEQADQPQGRPHRTPGGEEVVDGEHPLPRLDRVFVDRERVAAVLELVLDLDRLARKLAGLAHRHEPRLELMRKGSAEDEAARFDADDHVDSLLLIAPGEASTTQRKAGPSFRSVVMSLKRIPSV